LLKAVFSSGSRGVDSCQPIIIMKATLLFLFVVTWPIHDSAHALRLSSETCRDFGGKKIVLINLNHNYTATGMFYNWYHSAQPFLQKADAKLVIDISREDSKGLLQMPELSDHHVLMYPDGGLSTISMLRTGVNPDVNLGKSPFTDLMTHRVAAIQRLIEKGCTVMQVDIDTVWMANPFEDIQDPEAKTLVVTDDSKTDRWNRNGHTHFCGCFIYMTPKILSAKCNFFEKWIEETRHYNGNEQGGLNSALSICGKGDVPYDVLPIKWYADGPRTHFDTAHIIHANYRTSLEGKIMWLKRHKLWHQATVEWLNKIKA